MIISFKNPGTRDIFNGKASKPARRTLPVKLHGRAAAVMDRLNAAASLRSLALPGLRLEKLRGNREGQYSIRVNEKYRVCFVWSDAGALDVEIVDYH